jgi:hypothetical protein
MRVSEPIYIYGLFDPITKECWYIGQTRDPHERKEHHFNPFRGKAKDLPHLKYKILAEGDERTANRLEAEMIEKYTRKGEARLNKRRGTIAGKKTINNCSYRIRWVEGEIEFDGMSQAARYFRCSQGTISNAFKLRSGHLKSGVTLERKETWSGRISY